MLPFGNNGLWLGSERTVNIVTPRDAFLAAFSLHPAGVAVVTASLDDGTPVGFTASSLASFSADPPRATVNIARHATSFAAMTMGSRVLLHFLCDDQVSLARTMAGDHTQRFVGDHWSIDEFGLPRLHGVRALLIGTVVCVTEFGDNASVIIEIEDGGGSNAKPPLVYVERRFHAVGGILDG